MSTRAINDPRNRSRLHLPSATASTPPHRCPPPSQRSDPTWASDKKLPGPEQHPELPPTQTNALNPAPPGFSGASSVPLHPTAIDNPPLNLGPLKVTDKRPPDPAQHPHPSPAPPNVPNPVPPTLPSAPVPNSPPDPKRLGPAHPRAAAPALTHPLLTRPQNVAAPPPPQVQSTTFPKTRPPPPGGPPVSLPVRGLKQSPPSPTAKTKRRARSCTPLPPPWQSYSRL